MRKRPTSVHAEPLECRQLLDALPAGPEFLVNTYTTASQYATYSSRAVAMDTDGNFVVTWESYGQDGSVNGVYAQQYEASGAPVGSEFVVPTTTFGRQQDPSVAMDPDGDFVIVWNSNHLPGYYPNIYAQRFNAAGVPQGGELLVSQTTTVFNQTPVVAIDADGSFLVAWESQRLGDSQYEVYARRYSAAGAALGGEFLVNSSTSQADRAPSVDIDADGDFVVTWMHGQGFFGYDIYARRFDAAGVPLGDDFVVNSLTTLGQALPSIDMDGSGNFVIAWESGTVDPFDFGDIYARRFDSSGTALGTETLVNNVTASFQRYASVAVEPDGDFLVVYSSYYIDGSGDGVFGRRFAASGAPLADEFQINTYTTGGQQIPSVAIDADGDFVVIWNSTYNQDGSEVGVYAQRYANADAVPPSVNASSLEFQSRQAISITFNEPLNPASVAAADLSALNLDDAATPVANSVVLSGGDTIATWIFNTPGTFISDGDYTFTLPAGAVSDLAGNALAAQYEVTGAEIWFLSGDANRDRVVNANDFSILATNFGTTGRNFNQGDFNYDTIVNANDFSILATRFGTSLGSVSKSLSSRIGGAFSTLRIGGQINRDDEVSTLLA